MDEVYSYNFTCHRCTARNPLEGYHFAPTDTWIFEYPEEDLIHVHFGPAATSLDVGFDEAVWNVDVVIGDIFKRNPRTSYFVIIDLSRKNNTQFTPKKTILEYKKLISHPQVSEIAHYDVPLAMKAILEIIRVLTSAKTRYHVVDTIAEAETLYETWREKYKTN